MSDGRRSNNKFTRQASIVLADAFKTGTKVASIFPEMLDAVQIEPVELPEIE